jgi:hypothetical protein
MTALIALSVRTPLLTARVPRLCLDTGDMPCPRSEPKYPAGSTPGLLKAHRSRPNRWII